ncbi:nuclear transport factor 2 family protein [uncultured Desulfovibrio sp.]|uniref:nuclear transport factor 2 family protein n=1 Tax=uncultured Desulfovibrio sp. TaxID=167968 RepID=UPI0026210F60|nr:nuclear transport factor 2 family protein [uncultured Desulfovibrio sp.]
MKKLYVTVAPMLLALALACGTAHARANTVLLYTEAMLTGDVSALETLLAPNYWHISPNGHIRDKQHLIQSIRNKELVIDRLDFANGRTSLIGDAKLVTGTGHLKARSTTPLPEGLMRFMLVLVTNKGREQVVLFQATPVMATPDCKDGNCRIQ